MLMDEAGEASVVERNSGGLPVPSLDAEGLTVKD